jgi:hypothetical protein
MWRVKFQGIDRIYKEYDFENGWWDNVPRTTPDGKPLLIEKITFRIMGRKFVIAGADMYSIHKGGISPFGAHQRWVGYIFYSVYGNKVQEDRVLVYNVQKYFYHIDNCDVPLDRFRMGVGQVGLNKRI